MERRFLRKIILFLLLFNPVLLRAELDVARVRLEPLLIAKQLALRPEPISQVEFVEAALIFSGLGEADLPAYQNKMNAVLLEVKDAFAGKVKNRDQADELLQFLSKKYLKRYEISETGLPRLLDEGLYNCVSSSIFYMLAAAQLEIETAGVRTKDHAFVKALIGGVSYDVESTSRFGFDPGKKKEFTDEFGKTTGFVYAPPTAYADRKDVGRKEMLSLILNNRIAQLIAGRQFDAATGIGADLFELMKNEETFKILIGIFSGLSQDALTAGQYQDGCEILNQAASRYRDFNQFQELRRYFVCDWTKALIEKKAYHEAQTIVKREYAQGKISGDDYRTLMLLRYQSEAEVLARDPRAGPSAALALMDEAKKELGENETLVKTEKVYAHNHVLALVEKGLFPEASATLERYVSDKRLGPREFQALAVFLTQKRAEAVSQRENYWEALLAVEEGLAKTGDASALLKSAAVYAYNWGVKLIKSEDYAAAAGFLESPRAKNYLTETSRQELALYIFIAKAETAKKLKDYPLAISIIEEGIGLFGAKKELFRSYEILIHNHMIGFYDAANYDKAEEVLRRGLALYPASALFKNDLEKIKQSRQH